VTFDATPDYPAQTILVNAQGGSGAYEFLRVAYNETAGMKSAEELNALTDWVSGESASHTFTNCTAEWYQIAVRDKNDPDNLATDVIAGNKKLTDVRMIAAEPSIGGITVTWEAAAEAKFYQVYRLASGETAWTLLENTDDLSYVDTSAEVGIKYYYKVIARNGKQKSTFNIASVGAIRPLANVVMTGATGHRTGIIVNWQAVESAEMYLVYRRATDENAWTLVRKTTSTAIKDETAEVGVKYYYKVLARNGRYLSNLNIAAVSAVRPANPTGLEPVKMEKAVGYTSGIVVYWNAVEHAEVYHVYRQTKGETEWKLIATTGSLAYLDADTESGVTYSYKVVARYGSLTSSEDISPVSATRR
jgi:fibronectin type 3 domain-containing protein